MRYLGIDLETFSSVDLSKCGVYKYAESPDFEILLLGYAWDGEAPVVVDLAMGERIPPEVEAALLDQTVVKSAWNAAFERTCLARYFGRPMPPEQWEDTMITASVCGLPLSLGGAGAALGMQADQAKDKEGKALIRWFCQPCKPTKREPDRMRHFPQDEPEKWEAFKRYNAQDVVAERAIREKLKPWTPTGVEREIWRVDQDINDRGVRIDMTLARAAVEMDEAHKAELTARAVALTGMENPNSVAQIKQWLYDQEGVDVPSLNKKEVADVVAGLNTQAAKDFMALRAELSKSSTKKYDAMLRAACRDDHVRGCFMFCGAGRTGRWSGRLVQLQNLSKNKMEDLSACRALVRAGDLDGLKLLYGNVSGCLSELVRTALIPEQGHRFIVCDYSAIESRVLNWIAGEEWVLEEFHGDGLIYEATGSRMFGVPKRSIAKGGENHHLRASAKVAELACVAEDQLVLTNYGPVPIQYVTTDMKVWDGERWVRHDGVIRKGLRNTILVDGLEMTPDHKILTEKGMRECGKSEGLHWGDIRFPDRTWGGRSEGQGEWTEGQNAPMRVRLRRKERHFCKPTDPKGEVCEIMRVQSRRAGCERTYDPWGFQLQTVQCMERNGSALYEPEQSKLVSIRRSWGPGVRPMEKQLFGVPDGYGHRICARITDRQAEQRRKLHAGKLPVGDPGRKWAEQTEQQEADCFRRDDHCGRIGGTSGSSLPNHVEPSKSGETITLRRGRKAVPVFDILNAGPNHRFCLYHPETGEIRCVSNCGYGGGIGAMKAFGADKMGMSDEDIMRAVDLWRSAHPNVCRLWKAVERAAVRCVVYGAPQTSTLGGIRFNFEKGILWMTLPSGRRIAYFGARYSEGSTRRTLGRKVLSYMGQDQKTHKWVRLETYGPKMVENLVQATARDCLRDAMLALDREGYSIRAHIHDEVILSEPVGGRNVEDVAEVMGRPLPWAPGLPLRGDGYECSFYMKD